MTTQKAQAFYFLTPPFKQSCDDPSKGPSFSYFNSVLPSNPVITTQKTQAFYF